MYEQLHQLLQDRTGGIIFSCFGIWHFLYMLLIFGAIISVLCLARKMDQTGKHRVTEITISCAFVLYMLDFFLMPFAYGEIDVDKLPFHMCTSMCILSFWSRHNSFLGKFRTTFALLGLISNMIYVVYPAGVGWYEIHPLSYRVVQTLLFHGIMMAYGIFVLVLETKELPWKRCIRELTVTGLITVWAIFGNTLYSGTLGDYDHAFNWFFVRQDPFDMLPADIAVYVMPFVMIFVFFATALLIYGIWHLVRKTIGQKAMPSQIR